MTEPGSTPAGESPADVSAAQNRGQRVSGADPQQPLDDPGKRERQRRIVLLFLRHMTVYVLGSGAVGAVVGSAVGKAAGRSTRLDIDVQPAPAAKIGAISGGALGLLVGTASGVSATALGMLKMMAQSARQADGSSGSR